jgi:hypothetical protein
MKKRMCLLLNLKQTCFFILFFIYYFHKLEAFELSLLSSLFSLVSWSLWLSWSESDSCTPIWFGLTNSGSLSWSSSSSSFSLFSSSLSSFVFEFDCGETDRNSICFSSFSLLFCASLNWWGLIFQC